MSEKDRYLHYFYVTHMSKINKTNSFFESEQEQVIEGKGGQKLGKGG